MPSEHYERHLRFADVQASTDEVIRFHKDDLDRNGWDNQGTAYTTHISAHCGPPQQGHPYGFNCNGAIAGNADITLRRAFQFYFGIDDDNNNAHAYGTLGHEWGHVVQKNEVYLSDTHCLSEGVANMFGVPFAVKMVGGSNVHWGGDSCRDTPWQDDISGLNPGCFRAPYAWRARFDWLDCVNTVTYGACNTDHDCQPYEVCSGGLCSNSPDGHHNDTVWRRFMRVLAEGPTTFQNDSNNENVAVSFTASVGRRRPRWRTTLSWWRKMTKR
jgi:hypothetical protein